MDIWLALLALSAGSCATFPEDSTVCHEAPNGEVVDGCDDCGGDVPANGGGVAVPANGGGGAVPANGGGGACVSASCPLLK